MNKLAMIDRERNTIDTREVAEMMGIEHKLILRKLEGTKYGKTKGIIPILNENNFVLVDYFIESTYVDLKGEFNMNKLQVKGIMPVLTAHDFVVSDYFIH